MRQIILYGSQYGTSENYAKKLGELTKAEVCSYEKAPDLSPYGCIVYIGGLYAGTMTGLKQTAKRIPAGAKFLLASVGLADMKTEHSQAHIKKSLKRQMPEALFEQTEFFFLFGAIDYSTMSFKHKMMMAGLCRVLKSKPADKRGESASFLIQTYQNKGDLTEPNDLVPIQKAMDKAALS